jgi:hypothetical protein
MSCWKGRIQPRYVKPEAEQHLEEEEKPEEPTPTQPTEQKQPTYNIRIQPHYKAELHRKRP